MLVLVQDAPALPLALAWGADDPNPASHGLLGLVDEVLEELPHPVCGHRWSGRGRRSGAGESCHHCMGRVATAVTEQNPTGPLRSCTVHSATATPASLMWPLDSNPIKSPTGSLDRVRV